MAALSIAHMGMTTLVLVNVYLSTWT